MKNDPNFFFAFGFCPCSAALGAEEFLLDLLPGTCAAPTLSKGGEPARSFPENLVEIFFSIGLGVLLIGDDDLVNGGSSYFRESWATWDAASSGH